MDGQSRKREAPAALLMFLAGHVFLVQLQTVGPIDKDDDVSVQVPSTWPQRGDVGTLFIASLTMGLLSASTFFSLLLELRRHSPCAPYT